MPHHAGSCPPVGLMPRGYSDRVPWCDSNGVSLYYELEGAGDGLLCISGTGGDLRDRPRLTDGPLAESFQLLCYDQRGLGRSSVPQEPSSMADFADDAGRLLDAVGWEDCLVFGVSFGGMVRPGGGDPPSRAGPPAGLGLHVGRRPRRFVLPPAGVAGPRTRCQGCPPDGAARHPLGRGVGRAAHPEQVALIATRMLSGSGDAGSGGPGPGLANQLYARARHDTAARLGRIRCPTLVCGGRFDGLAPWPTEFLAQAVPDRAPRPVRGWPSLPAPGRRGAARHHRVSGQRSDATDGPVDWEWLERDGDTRVEGPGGALRRDLGAASAGPLRRGPRSCGASHAVGADLALDYSKHRVTDETLRLLMAVARAARVEHRSVRL